MKASKVILNVLMVIMGFAIWFAIYMAYETGELAAVGGSAVDMALFGFVFGVGLILWGLYGLIRGLTQKKAAPQPTMTIPIPHPVKVAPQPVAPEPAKPPTAPEASPIKVSFILTDSEQEVLNYITKRGGRISLSQASEELGLSEARLKETIDKLKEKKYLE